MIKKITNLINFRLLLILLLLNKFINLIWPFLIFAYMLFSVLATPFFYLHMFDQLDIIGGVESPFFNEISNNNLAMNINDILNPEPVAESSAASTPQPLDLEVSLKNKVPHVVDVNDESGQNLLDSYRPEDGVRPDLQQCSKGKGFH